MGFGKEVFKEFTGEAALERQERHAMMQMQLERERMMYMQQAGMAPMGVAPMPMAPMPMAPMAPMPMAPMMPMSPMAPMPMAAPGYGGVPGVGYSNPPAYGPYGYY